jgi:hypothetical protein
MADQKKWFKAWNSILTDPAFEMLSNDYLGVWTRLGCLLSLQGNDGILKAPKEFFYKHLRCDYETMMRVPNIVIEEVQNDNGTITVSLKHWYKYQIDSTSYERVKKFRNKQNDNGARGEENKKRIRREKNTPVVPNGFDYFWESYPKKTGKKAAYQSWIKAKNKPAIENILQTLESQKKSDQWLKDGGQYIPNPATWINQGRWDDEVKEQSWRDKVESMLSSGR